MPAVAGSKGVEVVPRPVPLTPPSPGSFRPVSPAPVWPPGRRVMPASSRIGVRFVRGMLVTFFGFFRQPVTPTTKLAAIAIAVKVFKDFIGKLLRGSNLILPGPTWLRTASQIRWDRLYSFAGHVK